MNQLIQFVGFSGDEGDHAQVDLISDADDISEPTYVGLHVHDDEGNVANIMLDARDALELSEHLRRAANQVYTLAAVLAESAGP